MVVLTKNSSMKCQLLQLNAFPNYLRWSLPNAWQPSSVLTLNGWQPPTWTPSKVWRLHSSGSIWPEDVGTVGTMPSRQWIEWSHSWVAKVPIIQKTTWGYQNLSVAHQVNDGSKGVKSMHAEEDRHQNDRNNVKYYYLVCQKRFALLLWYLLTFLLSLSLPIFYCKM